MNFRKIFEMQKELDEKISQRNDVDASNSNISEKDFRIMQILASLVETAEFANEVQTFKYWKAKKNIDHDNALEEFADILHFMGSFAYKYDVDPEIEPLILSDNVNYQICLLFQAISSMINNINKYIIGEILAMTLGVAKLLGYSDEDIIKWYYVKNKKNHERVENKY
ncbi:dUTP diphosphatase [Mycoplasmopsis felifaucium]|uniref:dUTP diphosphatase n=1 Tax=Mycoplasmopsis felifaucium TaxID=35768 RepID=A0ABZ2RUM7_9BACT